MNAPDSVGRHTTWAAVTWDTIANWPAGTRGELFLHESFHIVAAEARTERTGGSERTSGFRRWTVLATPRMARARTGAAGIRRAACRRPRARRWPSARLVTRDIRTKSKASAPSTSLKASPRTPGPCLPRHLRPTRSRAHSIFWQPRLGRGRSFVRTFTYTSGPAYGLLLDASSPGWTRTVRGSDDPARAVMRALGVQPVTDAAAAAARYGGVDLRAAEEQREQQREARMAELRQRFVDGSVFVMPCGGSGMSNSLGAVVIPGAGTGVLPSVPPVGSLRHARGGEWRARGVRWPLAASAGACARRRPDDLRRRVDIQGRGGLGSSRRTRAGATTKPCASSRECELKRSIE